MFSCIHCPSPVPAASNASSSHHFDGDVVSSFYCLGCIRKEITLQSEGKNARHNNHFFRIIHPPPATALAGIVPVCIDGSGAISVARLGRGLLGGAIGGSAVRTRRDDVTTSPVVVLIEIHPDGNIVYADENDRAMEWIALNSITYPCPRGGNEDCKNTRDSCTQVIDIDGQAFEWNHKDEENGFHPFLTQSETMLTCGGNVLVKNPKATSDVPMQIGRIPLVTSPPTFPWRTFALCLRGRSKSQPAQLVLNHVALTMPGKTSGSLLNNGNKCYSVCGSYDIHHGGIVWLSGYGIRDCARCQLKDRYKLFNKIPIDECITVLPPNARPRGMHDHMVVVDDCDEANVFLSSPSDGNSVPQIGFAMVRIYEDGRVVYMKAVKGYECKQPLRVFLDGIRFPLRDNKHGIGIALKSQIFDQPVKENVHPLESFIDQSRQNSVSPSMEYTFSQSGLSDSGDEIYFSTLGPFEVSNTPISSPWSSAFVASTISVDPAMPDPMSATVLTRRAERRAERRLRLAGRLQTMRSSILHRAASEAPSSSLSLNSLHSEPPRGALAPTLGSFNDESAQGRLFKFGDALAFDVDGMCIVSGQVRSCALCQEFSS